MGKRSDDADDVAEATYSLEWTHTVSGRHACTSHTFSKNLVIRRRDIAGLLGFEDPMLSKKHIELHPIVFDKHEATVPPLLYVKCLSRNSVDVQVSSLGGEKPPAVKLDRETAPYLLGGGDVLYLSPVLYARVSLLAHSVGTLTELQAQEVPLLQTPMTLTSQVIGSGTSGTVYAAMNMSSRRQLVCKVVDLHICAERAKLAAWQAMEDEQSSHHFSKTSDRDSAVRRRVLKTVWRRALAKLLAQGEAELAIQGRLSHACEIRETCFEEAYVTTHSIYIFQELLPGGDLCSYLMARSTHRLGDAESALIIRQILEAVKYLHANNIVHRDIKPENIQLCTWHAGGRVVLNDFGLAKSMRLEGPDLQSASARRMYTGLGTLQYAAPEIAIPGHHQSGDGYDSSVDIWAIGAVAALLLTATYISESFDTKHGAVQSSFEHAQAVGHDLSLLDDTSHPVWAQIASRPKHFIRQLLAYEPGQRPSAEQALRHSWFTKRLYKQQMDALYEKVIADWRPMDASAPIFVDTSCLGLGPAEDDSILERDL